MFTITNNPTDNTTQIFDRFYSVNLIVNGNEYDVVLSFFKQFTDKQSVAENFASQLFRIAQTGGYSVMSLLENLKGTKNNLELNQVMAYYLNMFKSRTSLYGTGFIPKPNEAVQRNIVV